MKDLIKQIKKARFVFICGNGGSASTAEHLSVDLFSKGIKAICLNSNTAVITKIANDHGYEFIFSDQLKVMAGPDDLLITISCSGTSQNIRFAQMKAEVIGLSTHAFETFENENRDYEALEDRHLQFVHQIKLSL